MKGALSVSWDGVQAGELRLNKHGEMSFAYLAEWVADPARPAISISLPKRTEVFGQRECRPFFAGLLPEEAQRDEAAHALGLSRGNDFALLKALGGDVAGALTLWPTDEPPFNYDGATATEPLGDNALVELLDVLPKRPFLAGREGLRLSLAGVQTKLPVVLVDGRIALPAPGQPTTHILKPPMPRFSATTENEAFAMRLAAAIGLSVAPVEPRKIADRPYLLVTRYDRSIDAKGIARRLHQEDFCQAVGIPPEHKYAVEGGPTFKTGFALLRSATSRPALEVLKLLDAAIFNLIVGNADAHGKNYSLLHTSNGITLAPLYDLLCTTAYPELSPKLAMKIGGVATIEQANAKMWKKFAEDTEIGMALVRRRAGELAEAMRMKAHTVAADIAVAGFDGTALDKFARIAIERADRIMATTQKEV
jgi:serine/threonine-protein kinase HipA